MWLSTVEGVISVLGKGISQKRTQRVKYPLSFPLTLWLSNIILLCAHGCVFIAINPERPIMRLRPG